MIKFAKVHTMEYPSARLSTTLDKFNLFRIHVRMEMQERSPLGILFFLFDYFSFFVVRGFPPFFVVFFVNVCFFCLYI